jgi:UDP-glucose:(heptosyl)LPS alpha-1,3-glucosyltransferase
MSSLSNKSIYLLKSAICAGGGLEKVTMRLAKAFCDKGCDVTLLTSGALPEKPGPFKLLCAPSKARLSFRKVEEFDRFCAQQIAKQSQSIVFGMDRNRFQTHLRAGNGVHAAYLNLRSQSEGFLKRLSFKVNPLHKLLLQIEKEAFEQKSLEAIFTNSHMVKEQISEHYAVDQKKIHVVHNGVQWHEMQGHFDAWPQGKSEQCRSLGLDPSLFHFLFVGHNYRRKGLSLLLEALTLLKALPFHLTVIGKDKNSALFKAEAEKLGLGKKVSFFGPRKDVIAFYQMADALVIPSLYDPFANVTVEALAMGLFVVSSLSNGGHEVLTKKSGSKIASLSDRESLAEALLGALIRPKTLESAAWIRDSVKELDYARQLEAITALTLRL